MRVRFSIADGGDSEEQPEKVLSLVGVLDDGSRSLLSGQGAVVSRYSDSDNGDDDCKVDSAMSSGEIATPDVCIEKDGTIKITTNRRRKKSN